MHTAINCLSQVVDINQYLFTVHYLQSSLLQLPRFTFSNFCTPSHLQRQRPHRSTTKMNTIYGIPASWFSSIVPPWDGFTAVCQSPLDVITATNFECCRIDLGLFRNQAIRAGHEREQSVRRDSWKRCSGKLPDVLTRNSCGRYRLSAVG